QQRKLGVAEQHKRQEKIDHDNKYWSKKSRAGGYWLQHTAHIGSGNDSQNYHQSADDEQARGNAAANFIKRILQLAKLVPTGVVFTVVQPFQIAGISAA